MPIMTKNVTFFINFYNREIVKLDHFVTLSLSYMQTPFCDASIAKSTVL